MRQRRHACGFTLLEVLVALAILATALYATTGSIRSAARQQAHRESSMLAHWVAMNVANELSLTPLAKDAPPATRNVTLYNQQFIATIKPARDTDGKISALTIAVALKNAPEATLHSLKMAMP
jgi:general secretion pathway protein I